MPGTAESRVDGTAFSTAADADLDPLLPEQYEDRCRRGWSPEQRLMVAVLEDAFRVRGRGEGAKGRSPRARYLDVRRWFASGDLRWPFSFLNVCAALDLDPAAVRTQARRIDPGQGRKTVGPSVPELTPQVVEFLF